MEEELIAPCGMNCATCKSYLAYENDIKKKGINKSYCPGCRIRDKKCAALKKNCKTLQEKKTDYCFECPQYPCPDLKKLDKKYRIKYGVSMIENLEHIKILGTHNFLEKEQERWECEKCGETRSCHDNICYSCETKKLKK